MRLFKDSFCRANLLFLFIFCFGLYIIGWQVYRSWQKVGLECETVIMRPKIVERIEQDKTWCENHFQPKLRIFAAMLNQSWCDFEHVNIGHKVSRNHSMIHGCFPTVPQNMSIAVGCPTNSTGFYWDKPVKHVTRKCNETGQWEEPVGHCGCHYDVFKWDRIAYYFSGFQKFKVMLVLFSATSLIFATVILLKLQSLHCTRNTIHLHLFVACLLYNTTDLVVFFFAITISTNDRMKYSAAQTTNVSTNVHKILCRGKDTMTIYSLLAIYTWVLIEGAYLHSLVLTAFHNGGGVTKMKYFAPFGWLFPLVITIIWIMGNVHFRHPQSICWDSNMVEPEDKWIGWIYDVPKKVLLLSATVLFLSVLRILWSKLSTSQQLTTLTTDAQARNEVSRNLPKFTQIVRASIILVIVYGIWDLKELFLHQDEFLPESTGWWIVMLIDILIDSMRGFFIASVYCFSNTEVRQELTRWYRRRCINNELSRNQRYGYRLSRRASSQPSTSVNPSQCPIDANGKHPVAKAGNPIAETRQSIGCESGGYSLPISQRGAFMNSRHNSVFSGDDALNSRVET